MITLETWKILTSLKKLRKNVGDFGKIIVATGFGIFPKCNKSPNLVTLVLFKAVNKFRMAAIE